MNSMNEDLSVQYVEIVKVIPQCNGPSMRYGGVLEAIESFTGSLLQLRFKVRKSNVSASTSTLPRTGNQSS